MSAEQDLANANVQIANLISEVTRFRDAAMGINNIWPTITEGRNNTADGKYFSVPGDGAYLKLYRRAGTSQTLIAEFPDRAQVQGIVDVLGGRGVVGGSGDLMAKGAGGVLGSALELLDPATINSLGSHFFSANINDHPIFSTSYTTGLVVRRTTDRWFALGGRTLGESVIISARMKGSADTVSSEVFLYHTGNIIGTVTQSGGVPTGAIIERGSNANGEYVKFADGSLFFSSVKDVNVASSGAQFFTAPVVYIPGSAPSVTVGHVSTSSPNPALYFDNIRALFLDPSAGYALRLKTAGVSSAPGTNSERLIFSAWARWY